jgi:hypothetical protein
MVISKRNCKIVPEVGRCQVIGAYIIGAYRIILNHTIPIASAAGCFHSDCFCQQSVYAVDHRGIFFIVIKIPCQHDEGYLSP